MDSEIAQHAESSINGVAEPSHAVQVVICEIGMDAEIVQLAGSSINGPSHAVRVDPEPRRPTLRAQLELEGRPFIFPAEPSHVAGMVSEPIGTNPSTLSNWLNYLNRQRERCPRPTRGKIHKVPDLLQANEESRSSYQPKVVSLGPYHFGEDRLREFQELKRLMANRLVPDMELEASLRSEIRNNIRSLMNAYSSYEMKTEHPSWWEEMFFLDGCFVLHFIFCVMFNRVRDLMIEKYHMDSVHNDLFLAENQLPFKLLQILSGNASELLVLVDEYIYTHKINNIDWDWRPLEPAHLLDRLRTIIGGPKRSQHAFWESWQSTHPPGTKSIVLRHAKELSAKGIHLKPNRTGFLNDIFFRSLCIYGTLRLPKIIVDNSTRPLFMNLAAYEMSAGVDLTITSYLCFLNSLVNHADDMKELQSAGVLVNHLATDEVAAELFNEMSQGLNLHLDEDTYTDVKWKIHEFFRHKTKAKIALWVAQGYQNHFKSPLTTIAFVAAFLVLALTAIQTFFTVFPRADK